MLFRSNPVTQSGTYTLPESQLDRFLMRIELGYPGPAAERELFLNRNLAPDPESLRACLNPQQLQEIRAQAEQVHASDNLLDYLQRIVAYTRSSAEFAYGLSPRGALSLLRSARTWAIMYGREHIIPEDIQAVLPAVAGHRLVPTRDFAGDSGALVRNILANVDVIG